MLKTKKLSKSSSDLPNATFEPANEPQRGRYRRRLAAELSRVRAEEQERLVIALRNQRERLHLDKLTELDRQKKTLKEAFNRQLRLMLPQGAETSSRMMGVADDAARHDSSDGGKSECEKTLKGNFEDAHENFLPESSDEDSPGQTTVGEVTPQRNMDEPPTFGSLSSSSIATQIKTADRSNEKEDGSVKNKGLFGRMCQLTSQLRLGEQEKFKLEQRLKDMEQHQAIVREQNREYFLRNLDLSTSKHRLICRVRQLTWDNCRLREDKSWSQRCNPPTWTGRQHQHHRPRAPYSYFLADEKENDPHNTNSGCWSVKPACKSKMSSYRSCRGRERWWSYFNPDDSSPSPPMSPIEEEDEESDWQEERRKLMEENLSLNEKMQSLQWQQKKLEAELQESRDQNDLLEFRILELEQCSGSHENLSIPEHHDQCINTDPWWWEADSPNVRLTKTTSSESSHSGDEDTIQDYREEKLIEVRRKLQKLVGVSLGLGPDTKAVLVQAMALLEVFRQFGQKANALHHRPMPPPPVIRTESTDSGMLECLDEDSNSNSKFSEMERTFGRKAVVRKESTGSDMADVPMFDSVSQGGETGYSSDDSADIEEMYPSINRTGKVRSSFCQNGSFDLCDGSVLLDNKVVGDKSFARENLTEVSLGLDWQEKARQANKRISEIECENEDLRRQLSRFVAAFHVYGKKLKVMRGHGINNDEHSTDCNVNNYCCDFTGHLDQLHNKIRVLSDSIQTELSITEQNSRSFINDSINPVSERSSADINSTDNSRIDECDAYVLDDSSGSSLNDSGVFDSDDSFEPKRTPLKVPSVELSKLPNKYLDIVKERLKQILDEKDQELKNKGMEYSLKMEALKCVHEDTMMRLEERLEALLKTEVELREQVGLLLKEHAELEENAKHRETEFEQDKSDLVRQMEELKEDKSKLERLSFSYEDEEVYEDDDGINNSRSKFSLQKIRALRMKDLIKSRFSFLQQQHPLSDHDKGEFEGTSKCAERMESKTLNGELQDKASCNYEFAPVDGEDKESSKPEAGLRQRILELEKKELAYRETLHEADKIMASVERSYQVRVEELEASEESLRTRIDQMEQGEKRLKQALLNTSRGSESVGRLGDLLDRLAETETSECSLKERIRQLESDQKALKRQILNLEKEKEGLELELETQEELIQSSQQLQRSERQLRGRVDELEASEGALKETLAHADDILAEREERLQERICELKSEVGLLKRRNEELRIFAEETTDLDDADGKNADEFVRTCSSDEKIAFPSCVFDLEQNEGRAKTMADILEVNAQLELQLAELHETNREIRARSLQLESQVAVFQSQATDNLSTPSEQKRASCGYLELNLELLARDSQIETLRDRIRILEAANTPSELQALSLHADEVKGLKDKINSMSSFIQNCDCCNCTNSRPLLRDIESQIQLLDEIISGISTDDIREGKLETTDITSQREHLREGEEEEEEILEVPVASSISNPLGTFDEPDKNIFAENMPSSTIDPKNIPNPTVGDWSGSGDQRGTNQNNNNVSADLVQDLHHQIFCLDKELQVRDRQISSLQSLIDELKAELSLKNSNIVTIRAELDKYRKENEEYQQKLRRSEISEQMAQDKLLHKNQELDISGKRIRDQEQKVQALNRQLRLLESVQRDSTGLRDRVLELEHELNKRRESERKTSAENLHLHHKVEAQKERINSMQIVKKDYRLMLTKYDVLEKQKAATEESILPLKKKVTQLTEKCKEKDQVIIKFSRQNKNNLIKFPPWKSIEKRKIAEDDDENSNSSDTYSENNSAEMVSTTPMVIESQPYSPVGSSLSSSTSSNESYDSCHGDANFATTKSCDKHDVTENSLSPSTSPNSRSRIPRYTALTSPPVSPRLLKPDTPSNKVASPRVSSNLNSPKRSPCKEKQPHKAAEQTWVKVGICKSPEPSIYEFSTPFNHIQKQLHKSKEPPLNFKNMNIGIGEKNQKGQQTGKSPPPPTNFCITRKVGKDSLLVAWTTPEVDNLSPSKSVSGYQIFVNEDLHQKVRSPQRTKALLNNLDLSKPLEISMVSLSESGVVSQPIYATYNSSVMYKHEPKTDKTSTRTKTKDFNQNFIKRKCIATSDYNRGIRSPVEVGMGYELEVKVGDLVTVFGQKTPNGFFYGEINGQRGLILADVIQELSPNQLSTTVQA